MAPPAAAIEAIQKRRIVDVGLERVEEVTEKSFPGHYHGEDNSWNLDEFRSKVHVKFHQNDPNHAVFSLVGIDASLANAYRRILLSSLPHVAICDVLISQNTSIVQDEVLAHRLGLVPLRGNKDGIRWLQWRKEPTEENPTGDMASDINTFIMRLHVKCEWKSDGKEKAKKWNARKLGESEEREDLNDFYTKPNVYASDLTFHPFGQQSSHILDLAPVNPDILLAKLRPDQEIDIECRAQKGVGSDHAKFSPVATASYRLQPTITILSPILGESAEKFAKCFPPGVIDIQEVTVAESKKRKDVGYEGKAGEKKAVVANAINDTVSRECLRHEEFRDKVKLGRVRDNFIFSVESVGQQDSEDLFLDSVRALREKCVRLKREVVTLKETG